MLVLIACFCELYDEYTMCSGDCCKYCEEHKLTFNPPVFLGWENKGLNAIDGLFFVAIEMCVHIFHVTRDECCIGFKNGNHASLLSVLACLAGIPHFNHGYNLER